MDAVITYVDGLDPQWQKQYAAAVGMDTFMAKRFRDWGTLKYLLRGIQKHMPYVENVHLVVSGESQVPSWVDKDNLHVVLHADIIPSDRLPVFNSASIEMFLHRIPGLAEEYVYFNDDFFPVADSTAETFFRDGKAVVHMSRCLLATNLFKKQVKNSDVLARKAAGLPSSWTFLRPQHTCAAMLRKACEEIYSSQEDFILRTVTPLREDFNCNQYLYSDYQYLTGRTVPGRIPNRHFSLAVKSAADVCAFLSDPKEAFMCVNDVKLSEQTFLRYRDELLAGFEKHFPEKSRFEL